jgi:hypothetical protein
MAHLDAAEVPSLADRSATGPSSFLGAHETRASPVGVMSTHFRSRHRVPAYRLHLIDIISRQIAELIDNKPSIPLDPR